MPPAVSGNALTALSIDAAIARCSFVGAIVCSGGVRKGEGIVCGGKWSVQVGATPPLCWWNQPSLALDASRGVIVEMPLPEFQRGRTSDESGAAVEEVG
jgi:hypothetical protein